MTAQEIRTKYLAYFAARGHAVIPRALLVPQNDPSTLFTGAGMQPMIPYLLGEAHPDGVRLADSQTCLRAQDIDEVGDNRHTTFFEMLGNWSLGDYFKAEQVPWIFEFLVDEVGLDPTKLYITCFSGAPQYDIPQDEAAAEIWHKLFAARSIEAKIAIIGSEEQGYKRGIKPDERIFYYDGSKNWWSRNGNPETSPFGDPCGPDSEMFYDFGEVYGFHQAWIDQNIAVELSRQPQADPELLRADVTAKYQQCHPNCDCGRFMEIGNNVFMAYRKVADGVFEPLTKPNIDHGSGLERIAAASIDNPDVFRISLMWPIIEKLQVISGKNYASHTKSMRVIADHLRAATFLAVDGIVPSNKEQGYVMRRLLRRAIRYAFQLGVEQNFLEHIVPVIADLYSDDFPEVKAKRDEVIAVLVREEKAFRQTLKKGLKELNKLAGQTKQLWTHEGSDEVFESCDLLIPHTAGHDQQQWIEADRQALTGKDVFMLSDTYGFPWTLTLEEATLLDVPVTKDWSSSFHVQMEEQKNRSRTATKGEYKGGLGGHTLQHKKYHTATHLMYQALRMTLGDHVIQRGSNITEERLRFDFSHDDKLTPEQITNVEAIVNRQIRNDLKIFWQEYPTQTALDMGALGAFGDRYGDSVKIYQMGEGDSMESGRFSFEICGGPHVDHTGQLAGPTTDGVAHDAALFDQATPTLKRFKILKEESSSAGIRRIKAVLQ